MNQERAAHSRVVCIGSGIAGIGLAVQLQESLGCNDFHIYDRNTSPGGVWAVQKYPGVACDIPADLYSFSFAPGPVWSKFRPRGDEFQKYLHDLVTSHGLWPSMTFKTECESATWIEDSRHWLVKLRDLNSGQQYSHTCDILCVATGQLSLPKIPPIPGLEDFRGPVIHTASWDSKVDLSGKNIAVFGNGASGSQLVPEIVSKASNVFHIFRTPQWYISPVQVPYTPAVRWILQNVPFARRILRFVIFLVAELAFRGSSLTGYALRTRQKWQRDAERYIKSLAPPKYHDILIPKYDMGCKRPVFNTGYLQCLHDPKVKLLAQETAVSAEGVVCQGTTHPVDVIILATGYRTNRAIGFPVVGRNGESMDEHWESMGGPAAYGTIAVHGFPNLFLVKGPNTVTGHTSAILVAENVIQLILKMMSPVLAGKASTVEVTAVAEKEYCNELQAASRRKVWYSGCTSNRTVMIQDHPRTSSNMNSVLRRDQPLPPYHHVANMSEPSPKPTKLNSQVFLFESPSDAGSKAASSDPAVIIAFSWIDARLSHSQKYTDKLRELFPTSTIVLVMVTAGFYLSLEKTRESVLSPVVNILQREKDNGNISKGILLFVMSNGGGFQLMTLRKMLSKAHSPTTSSQNPVAVVYDSTPGDNGLESAISSNAPSNPLTRLIIVPLIALTYGVLFTFNFLAGNRPLFDEYREACLQTDILPSLSKPAPANAVPRLYIYSKKDKMTPFKHVESHLKEANLLGLDVTTEVFQDTPSRRTCSPGPGTDTGAPVRKVWLRALQQVQSQL
ncbi:hypothetical protein NP233_g2892 [Leucocoprinus birnbaumii]|uniref:Uncharacterized protein n=1 Tax=Leucocoprinus birnbaumii TaxID=56174 RepID=A0AAD5VY39_9AGAR|nr:hypothetical protein NP233_g2892 [Leucocoprinus birnbaumii]